MGNGYFAALEVVAIYRLCVVGGDLLLDRATYHFLLFAVLLLPFVVIQESQLHL